MGRSDLSWALDGAELRFHSSLAPLRSSQSVRRLPRFHSGENGTDLLEPLSQGAIVDRFAESQST